MRIAIQTYLLQQEKCGYTADFLFDLFVFLARQQPYHHFIFLTSRYNKPLETFPHNVEQVNVTVPVYALLFRKWVAAYKQSRLLQKHKVDVLVMQAGVFGVPSDVPCVLLINVLAESKVRLFKKGESIQPYKKGKISLYYHRTCKTGSDIQV